MGLRFAGVADLEGGGSVLDVGEVGHGVSDCDGPQGSRRHPRDVAVELGEGEEKREIRTQHTLGQLRIVQCLTFIIS